MASIFQDEFVPNIQSANKTNYSQWKQSNPKEAAAWEQFRDKLYTYKAGDHLTVPVLSTKYGKALVAAGKQHMSVTDIGASYSPPSLPIPPTLQISPPQPAAVIYNSDAPSTYANAGAMVDMNSAETPGAIAVSNAGGTVLVYVDVIVDASGGNYTSLINNANQYGPAIGRWPGQTASYNAFGYVRDLLTLVNSGKLLNILNKVVADNPHMGGFFADDFGTTNVQYKTPMISGTGNGYVIPTDTFYNACIAALQVFRTVANQHGLMICVNGQWDGRGGGGYPNRSAHGCSLAESTCVEHHTKDAFWTAYTSATQWADSSPVTQGTPAHFVIATPGDNTWDADTTTAWIAKQSDYSSAPAPWTSSFHANGLPTHAS